ncbi:MAG: helix-turn-helix domain-containing protein [Clostridium sp.]|jgi:transcriptional regulator with XRE-family HTH domain|uniref:helix-turn-helix domain-containing protein n=1 Tax=Clostridium sp. TaxID=1506 RepID=UPI0025BAB3CB|nr:helix-turn-helix transcriptional regulator [Clostridium sp.]MCH3965471.1 helix-turn-helix domain-containing protein [Clostridium sp.]MCI2202801.1 helix-turn-helix domain-containing protein [Clostridium sp.]
MESIFSKRLKEVRLKNNLTQQKLANLVNEELESCNMSDKKVSRVSITRYENGTRTPDYDTLCIISQVLETDLEYLLGKSNKKYYVAANEELNSLMGKITDVIEEDDKKTNDLLWNITYTFEKLIDYGIENNALTNIRNIFDAIERIVNMSINENKSNIVKDAYIMLMLYAKYVFYNINPDYLKKLIDRSKKHEEFIIKSISHEKYRKDHIELENELLKENPILKKVLENNSEFGDTYEERCANLKKELENDKKEQIRLKKLIPYIAEEQKLIYKLLHHDEQHE